MSASRWAFSLFLCTAALIHELVVAMLCTFQPWILIHCTSFISALSLMSHLLEVASIIDLIVSSEVGLGFNPNQKEKVLSCSVTARVALILKQQRKSEGSISSLEVDLALRES